MNSLAAAAMAVMPVKYTVYCSCMSNITVVIYLCTSSMAVHTHNQYACKRTFRNIRCPELQC